MNPSWYELFNREDICKSVQDPILSKQILNDEAQLILLLSLYTYAGFDPGTF